MKVYWQAARSAGEILRTFDRTSEIIKEGDVVGHHSIVTEADTKTQQRLLSILGSHYPRAKFLVEEESDDPLVMMNPEEIWNHLIFGIDPLDGTSSYRAGLYEYSVSVGMAENGWHLGGSIYAPAVLGGLQVSGERGMGVEVREGYGQSDGRVVKRSFRESIVCHGPDIYFLPQFGDFLREFSGKVRTTLSLGSCAVGLALLAAGKIDAFVQPVQCPWDWFAGYPLVEEAGGVMQFYHYRTGELTLLEKPDTLSYNPVGRHTAFIAGNNEIVPWLLDLLRKSWRA